MDKLRTMVNNSRKTEIGRIVTLSILLISLSFALVQDIKATEWNDSSECFNL